MKYSVCVESMFEGKDVYEKIEIVKDFKDQGVSAIELWDASRYDTARIGRMLSQYGLGIAVCCLSDNWTYRMNRPFKDIKPNVERSIKIAKELGCSSLICMGGEVTTPRDDTQKYIITENLKRLTDLCEKEDVTLLMEPLNSIYDHKGFYLDSSYVGFEMCKVVNSPHIKILFDCYHMQIMEGNLVNNLTDNIDYVGHIHSAGVPGRHELHLGETNYPRIVKALEDAGYRHYFGLEYFPSYDDKQSLADVLRYVQS